MRSLLLLAAIIPATLAPEWPVPVCPIPLIKPAPEVKINMKDLKCLAVTIYAEARGEPYIGQISVAYTLVNRATKKSICKVALAPKQYSVFNNNPKLRAIALSPTLEPKQKNEIDVVAWLQAMEVAETVLRKETPDHSNGATHYVAYKSLNHIPRWTYIFKKTSKIGNHTFFKEKKEV